MPIGSLLWHDLKAAVVGARLIAGSFAPDTANAPTTVLGRGFTVAYTSTGLFTVTLKRKFQKLINADLTLQLASGDDKYLQLGTVDLAAKTVQIRVWDASGAAVANIAANANNRIHFKLLLATSNQPAAY